MGIYVEDEVLMQISFEVSLPYPPFAANMIWPFLLEPMCQWPTLVAEEVRIATIQSVFVGSNLVAVEFILLVAIVSAYSSTKVWTPSPYFFPSCSLTSDLFLIVIALREQSLVILKHKKKGPLLVLFYEIL